MREESHHHGIYGGGQFREEIKEAILELMELGPEDVVADLGSGAGSYSASFAELAKKVYAVDLGGLAFESTLYDSPGIVKIEKDLCQDFELPADVTHVFFSNSFHDIECRDTLLSSVPTILKSGARLTMVEFELDTPFGPPRSIRISKEQLKDMVEAHGFQQVGQREFQYHYALSFVRL